MDLDEKRVLRRKRHVIATHFQWNGKNVKFLKDNKLVTVAMLEHIQAESSNFGKVVKYLELLNAYSHKNLFTKLCDALDRDYSWISDELLAELRCERGEVPVEEYINKETGILVMKEFGSSKRLSEMEKKDIHDLVAKRTQCTKEVWRRQVEKSKDALDAQHTINRLRDEKLREMIDKIRAFIEIHKSRLRGQGVGAELESCVKTGTAEEEEERPLVDILCDLVKELREMTSQSLVERDNILGEKSRALAILGVHDTTNKVDKELGKAVEKTTMQIQAAEKEIQSRDQKIGSLNQDIENMRSELEAEMERKDKNIQNLKANLNACHDRIRGLSDEIDRLRRELEDTKEELKEFRSKSMLLEKSRRLGYLHDKGSTKLEGISKVHIKSAVGKKPTKRSAKSTTSKNM